MLRQSILLVDDEEVLIRALRGLLRDERYQIMSANSGKEALALVSKHSFATIIADQRMPKMSGSDLLEEVRFVSEDTVRVILSGFSDLNMMMDVLYQGRIYLYLKKPWEEEQLLGALRQSILQYEVTRASKIKTLPMNYVQTSKLRDQGLLSPLENQSSTLGIFSEILSLTPSPALMINDEGQVLFINQAARLVFTTYSELMEPLDIREILEPALLDPLETFLGSNESETRHETSGGIVAMTRLIAPEQPPTFCLRYFIDDNKLETDSES